MIVVIGATELRGEGSEAIPGGVAGRIAAEAAAAGARVELVAKVGDDPDGDALLLALVRAGVGHVAVLRDGVHRTPRVDGEDEALDPAHEDVVGSTRGGGAPALEPADVALALRYLADYGVIVVVDPTVGIGAEAVAAADWAGARLVIVTITGSDADLSGLPDDAVVLAVEPDDGPTGADAVSARVGAFAAALDRGADPATAFTALTTVA